MKLKVLLCLLSFVAALYLLDAVLNKIAPDRQKPEQEANLLHKIPVKEPQTPKPTEKQPPADTKKEPRMMVVQNGLPAKLAAAIAAAEKKPEPAHKKPDPTPEKKPVKVKTPPPAPKPAPKMVARVEKAPARPAKPKTLASKTISISREQSAIGERMQREGQKLPAIEASWGKIGFTTYLKMMQQIGGHLYVGDTLNQSILAEVELHYYNGQYRFMNFNSPGSLQGLALFRPREIADEPLVNDILTAAFDKWPESPNLAVVVLLPARVETGFLGSLKQYLESNAHAIDTFDIVRGEYFVNRSGLGLEVKTAINRNTHQVVNLGLKIMI
jgi:hypothetical protein